MIRVELPDGTVTTASAGTVDDILQQLGQNPYELLAVRNDELLLAEDMVEDGAEIKLVSIVHGG
ncbi:MAG TPA: MoaD/ThiS family protein [Methanocorpusculum sp.]|nr:MoaD/ThiS family protein [Methanocorpusculum sp.]